MKYIIYNGNIIYTKNAIKNKMKSIIWFLIDFPLSINIWIIVGVSSKVSIYVSHRFSKIITKFNLL